MLLGFGVLPLVMWSGHLYYADGGSSPDAPGMLLMSLIFTLPTWLGAWLTAIAFYLWGYRGSVPVVVGVGITPLSLFLSIVAWTISLVFVWAVFARVEFWRPTRLPLVLHLLACAAYWQYLRAAAVARSRG